MSSHIANICFDAHDPYAQSSWWNNVLDDFTLGPDDAPGDEECGLEGPNGQALLFLKVPEGKTVKNRAHLCLVSAQQDRDAEVQRLLDLGAAMYDDRRLPDGKGWAVLQDPEGNEFCVLRSDAERAADQPSPAGQG
ncbi:VOC family protein [Nakamurella lactea]|uniref:VOC family protein n=1 Tax=Nakamurella lactea TaxID=459515 RepID=UPI00041003C4|nr:VOC family protein [Nakamurella lactea]